MDNSNKPVNSFMELPSDPPPPPEVEGRVFSTLTNLRFIGDIFDLYFSKLFHTLMELISASSNSDDKK